MRGVFSVVSGTTLRFVSLVAAIVGTSIYAFSMLYTSVPGNAAEAILTYGRCGEIFERELGQAEAAANLRRCLAPFEEKEAASLVAGLAFLLAVAAGLYLVAPWWIRRRSKLVPLTGARFSALREELAGLCVAAGLKTEPRFLLDPVAAAPGGLAFGRSGRQVVRLNAGLIVLRITNPAMFRAIVLHELAHIRNRDVDIAYATVALWRAFVVVALLPLAAFLVLPLPGKEYWTILFNLGTRAAALAVLVYLIRNAVLRTREKYADVRAATFAAGGGLRAAIERTRPAGVWRHRLGVHPSPQARLRAIDDPVSLLRLGFGEMFSAGLTTMIAAGTFYFYVALAAGVGPAVNVMWLFAPMAAGILGAAAWRAEVGSVRGTVLPAAIAFSLGCLAGDQLMVTNAAGHWGIFGTPASAVEAPAAGVLSAGGYSLLTATLAALLLTAGMACQAAVSAYGARAWLPRLPSANTRWAWLGGIAAATVPFAIWLGVWFDLHRVPFLIGRTYQIPAAGPSTAIWEGPGVAALTTFYPPLGIFEQHPLAIPAIMLAWLYPFAARTVNVRPAVLIGLWVSAGFAVILIAARALLHLLAADLVATTAFARYFTYAAIGIAIVVQAAAGGAAASAATPFRVLLGQLSAFVVAICCIILILASEVLGGCVPAFQIGSEQCTLSPDSGHVGFLLRRIIIEGALAALAAAVLMKVTARFTVAWRTAAVATALAMLIGSVQLTYAAGDFTPTQPPSASAPATPATTATPGPPLTQTAVENAARAFATGLPPYWREETPRTSQESPTYDNDACLPIARETYLDALDPQQKNSTARVYLTNDGSLSLSTLDITISSYLVPIPAAVFAQAHAAQEACPAFTATDRTGFQAQYQITAAQPPRLGDQAWRVNMTLRAARSGLVVTGTQATIMVRIGQTIVFAIALAINDTLDETLFLAAVTRAVDSLS